MGRGNGRAQTHIRGQAATEYIMIAGILLVIIGIAYMYSTTVISNSVDDSKTRTAVNNIAKAIDQVYALGPGSKISVIVDLPSGVQSQIVDTQLVGYILTVNGQPSHYYADTKADLIGSLPMTQGVHQVTLTVNTAGKVVVGETGYGLFITPKGYLVSVDANVGYSATPTYNLLNSNPTSAGSIIITKSGTASSLITVGSYPSTLAAGQDANIGVTVSIPVSQPIGTYSAYLQVDSNNGSDRALIQIVVNAPGTTEQPCITIDTNWETSWTQFDANLKATYPLKTDVNNWGDLRYAPIGTTPIIKVTTADQTTNNTNTSITGLDIALGANKSYGFHCYLTASSGATNVGIRLAMLTPATPTYFSAKIISWTNATTLNYTIVTASDTYTTTTTSQGTANYVYEISGAIHNVNAGTLTPRFRSENATSITIRAGSWCEYTQGA